MAEKLQIVNEEYKKRKAEPSNYGNQVMHQQTGGEKASKTTERKLKRGKREGKAGKKLKGKEGKRRRDPDAVVGGLCPSRLASQVSTTKGKGVRASHMTREGGIAIEIAAETRRERKLPEIIQSPPFQADKETDYDPVGVLEELLANQADVNRSDQFGRSPLHLVAGSGSSIHARKMVSSLLRHGSSIESVDSSSFSPLHIASAEGHVAIIVALVEEGGADVNMKGGKTGDTPLMQSVREGHSEAARYLLSQGADVTMVDDKGDCALSVARSPRMKRMLREAWTEQTREKKEATAHETTPSASDNERGSPPESPRQRDSRSFFLTDRQISRSLDFEEADLISPLQKAGPVSEFFSSAPHLPQSQLEADDELEGDQGLQMAMPPKKHSLEERGTWKKKSGEKKKGKGKMIGSKMESGGLRGRFFKPGGRSSISHHTVDESRHQAQREVEPGSHGNQVMNQQSGGEEESKAVDRKLKRGKREGKAWKKVKGKEGGRRSDPEVAVGGTRPSRLVSQTSTTNWRGARDGHVTRGGGVAIESVEETRRESRLLPEVARNPPNQNDFKVHNFSSSPRKAGTSVSMHQSQSIMTVSATGVNKGPVSSKLFSKSEYKINQQQTTSVASTVKASSHSDFKADSQKWLTADGLTTQPQAAFMPPLIQNSHQAHCTSCNPQNPSSETAEQGRYVADPAEDVYKFTYTGKEDELQWKGHGITLHFPSHSSQVHIDVTVSVLSTDDDKYTLPEESELVSEVYTISASRPFPVPVTVKVQHCVPLNNDDEAAQLGMFFFSADTQQGPPYAFHEQKGGCFRGATNYGVIELTHSSHIGIKTKGRLGHPILLFASVYYSEDNNATFVVTQNLAPHIAAVKRAYKNDEPKWDFCVKADQSSPGIGLKPEVPPDFPWKVTPHVTPAWIDRDTIFQYRRGRVIPQITLTMKWMGSGQPAASTIQVKLTGVNAPKSFSLQCIPNRTCKAISSWREKKPTLGHLIGIKYRVHNKENMFNLVEVIQDQWETIGHKLDLPVNGIAKHKSPKEMCYDVLKDWMRRGSQSYPVVWSSLINLLNDINMHEVAKDLEKALVNNIEEI